MLHIILLIFKIIGFLLLTVLCLLLLLILMVLLVPIRYRIHAEHGKEVMFLDARVNWFLSLLRANISYVDQIFHLKIKLLWFTLYDNLKPKKPRVKRKKIKNSKQKKIRKNKLSNESDLLKTPTSEGNRSENKVTKSGIKEETSVSKITKADFEPECSESILMNQQSVPMKEDKVSNRKLSPFEVLISKLKKVFQKLKNLMERVKGFFSEVKEKILQMFENLKNVKHKMDLLTAFIKDEINREGFQITFSSIKKLLKHILPTKLRSRIIFGTGDPSTTGQILGAAGVFYSFYGDKLQIIPDFENIIFEGNHYARGRIRLVTILIIVIKLMLNKRFKQLTQNIKILKEAL